MSVKLLATLSVLASLLTSLPAMALPPPNQILGGGENTFVSGRAHVFEDALGTFIFVERPAASVSTVAGFIPFGSENNYPDPEDIDGRMVQINGVVGMFGLPRITMTDPDQFTFLD